MKLVVRQYLQGMKERGELDVLLPQLLSELGFEVLHHPKVGSRQAGVDVAAVGPDPDMNGNITLHLFVIKSGNLGRKDWDGSIQAVRPSLGEVLDDYIPNRIPEQFKNLPIAVCICMGGEVEEGIRAQWSGYVSNNTKENLHFREWNGDRLANLIISGILNQELLEPIHRSHFQKAIALVSEPDESYINFRKLLNLLTEDLKYDKKSITRLRQVLICLSILVTNGIEVGNLDAPYRSCELTVLHAWDALNNCPPKQKKRFTELYEIFDQTLSLYLKVSDKYVFKKLGPHASNLHALSSAVRSRSFIDIHLSLFEMLGRVALHGLWHHSLAYHSKESEEENQFSKNLKIRNESLSLIISMINNNPSLLNPMRDDHHIEIGLVMLLAECCDRIESIEGYLLEIASRLEYRYSRRLYWPTCLHDYKNLVNHPVDCSDEYFKRSTIGSVLVPFVLVGLERLGDEERLAAFKNVVAKKLEHMTQQVWVPHERTDSAIWRHGDSNGIGISVPAMNLSNSENSLSEEIQFIVDEHQHIAKMKAVQLQIFPLLLNACRHHRLPLPPHYWFGRALK